MWRDGYINGDALKLVDNYQRYACNSMIATRLKALDDRTIHDLVNLGYLAADLSIGQEAVLRSIAASGERSSKLETLIKNSIPGLLRTHLQLPMPLDTIPSKPCREALE